MFCIGADYSENSFFCNTWGLNSVNSQTFSHHGEWMAVGLDFLRFAMKISFFALDILGYIPGIAIFSGLVRVSMGLIIAVAVEIAICKGKIAGPYIQEARGTARGQMVRGILEMIPFYGQCINGVLDILHTIKNVQHECV